MTFRYPFYNQPFSYNRYYNNYQYKKQAPVEVKPLPPEPIKEDIKQTTEKRSSATKEDYFFDLFGIHLFFDDILLVCLIFFLYNEGVKDEGLFMALILLLLT